jgi:hypothetical protein
MSETQWLERNRENKLDFFSNFYCDLTQFNHAYTAHVLQGIKRIYNLKHN